MYRKGHLCHSEHAGPSHNTTLCSSAAGRWSRRSPSACAAGGRSARGSPTRCAHPEAAPASTRRRTSRPCGATSAAGGATCAAPKCPPPPTGARPPSSCVPSACCRCQHLVPFPCVGVDINMGRRWRRPSCYNCGEGGHTADECRRERPPLVRNEQQPALNQSTWDYGRGHGGGGADDYRGSRGYDNGNTARCVASGQVCEQRAPCSAVKVHIRWCTQCSTRGASKCCASSCNAH